MKARNPQTGEFQEVYVKALDSMPVGTEVDFDGNSADIPAGWKQVDDKAKILWTNSNPTSDFASQNITLNSSDYDILEIVFIADRVNQDNLVFNKVIKGKNNAIQHFYTGGNFSSPSAIYIRQRYIEFVDSTHYTIGNCNQSQTSSISFNTNNGGLVPLYVIGYKTGLFS